VRVGAGKAQQRGIWRVTQALTAGRLGICRIKVRDGATGDAANLSRRNAQGSRTLRQGGADDGCAGGSSAKALFVIGFKPAKENSVPARAKHLQQTAAAEPIIPVGEQGNVAAAGKIKGGVDGVGAGFKAVNQIPGDIGTTEVQPAVQHGP